MAAVFAEELLERLRKEAKEATDKTWKTRRYPSGKFPEGERPRDVLAKKFGVNNRYVQDALAIKAIPDELSLHAFERFPDPLNRRFRDRSGFRGFLSRHSAQPLQAEVEPLLRWRCVKALPAVVFLWARRRHEGRASLPRSVRVERENQGGREL
jgi:hypothetical protein